MQNKILTIIPQSENGLVAEISENKVNVITKIDIPYNSISKIINNKTIVTLDKENKQLLFHSIDGRFIKSMDVPFGIAMNVKDSVVYVGGNTRSGEVCHMVDLESEAQTLQNIELPEPMSFGKAVDDILIVGNKMMLIDDIVYPKYTFEYDISDPNTPQWVNTVELSHSRVYEHIIKGDMNEEWMIYLSSSRGLDHNGVYITVEGKKEFVFASEQVYESPKPYFTYKDIALVDDRLYVLTDIGLGYYDLMVSNIQSEDIRFVEHKIVADRIIKVDKKQLLLIDKYGYELLELESIHCFNGNIMDKFWSNSSIDLSNRELEVFPTEIKNLRALQHLDLSDNKLKEFPKVLRECKQLRSLNLKFSGITKIPHWIEEFENLEYLNISTINIDNPIPFMASRIKFPKNLKILNLRYCGISAMPPSVFELENLEYLNLLENNISKIPDKIRKLKNLKTLRLRWEEVRSLSDGIKELPLLEKLK